MPAWPSGSTRRVVPRYRAARILPRWRLTPSSKRASASARSVSGIGRAHRTRRRAGPGCVIGAGSSVGPDSLLHAHVTLYEGARPRHLHSGVVLGADGFGFAPDPSLGRGAWGKIPSWAAWPSATTSRSAPTPRSIAARSKTPSADGVKLDNQIMVGHNCRIGAHTAMAACVGWPVRPPSASAAHRRRRDAVGAPDAGRRCAYFGWHRGDVQYPEAGPVYRGLPVRRARRMAAQRRRDTTVGAVAPPRALARKARVRRPAHAARSFHFAGIHRKMELDIKGIMGVCRIVTRCC